MEYKREYELLKERLEGLENLLSDGIVIMDLKGFVLSCNEAFYTLTGFTPEEIVGKHLTKVPTIKDIKEFPKYGKVFAEVVMGREVKDFPFKWQNKDKSLRYGLANLSKIRLSDGRLGLIVVLKDTTREILAKERVENERKQFLSLLDGLRDSISVTDPVSHRVLFQNRTNKELFGDITGQICYETFYRLEKPCQNCKSDMELLRNKSNVLIAKEKLHPVLKRWFGHYSKFITWTDGKPVRLGMALDITDRKSAELALAESEKRYRSLVENFPSAIAELDKKGNIIYANKTAFKMTGYTDRDIKDGLGIDKLIAAEDLPRAKANISKLLENHTGKENNYKALKKDGTEYFVEVHTNLVKDNNDEIKGIRALILDITDRIDMEKKLEYLSFHDSLTGLYNRAYFEEELKRLDTKRSLPLSIITGDLNSLKLMNDTFSHEFGDKVLCKVADILKSCFRADDIVARWGGDEFSVILPETPNHRAEELIHRINDECAKIKIGGFPISISLGSAEKTIPEQDIRTVIQEAEDIMYRRKLNERNSITSSIISALGSTLRLKSYETEEHGSRLKELSLVMGKRLGLSGGDLDKLVLLSRLHDLGKILIPESILKKSGSLTKDEYEAVKKHPEAGYNICESSPTLSHISEYILCHHEWWNGKGYPRGLKGKKIPKLSRILSILDAYDVMLNGRPYKKKITKEAAIAELKRFSGTQFDPELVDTFISLIE